MRPVHKLYRLVDAFAEKMLEETHIELLHLQVDKRKFHRGLDSRANALGATQEDFMNRDSLAPLRQKANDLLCGKQIEASTGRGYYSKCTQRLEGRLWAVK